MLFEQFGFKGVRADCLRARLLARNSRHNDTLRLALAEKGMYTNVALESVEIFASAHGDSCFCLLDHLFYFLFNVLN